MPVLTDDEVLALLTDDEKCDWRDPLHVSAHHLLRTVATERKRANEIAVEYLGKVERMGELFKERDQLRADLARVTADLDTYIVNAAKHFAQLDAERALADKMAHALYAQTRSGDQRGILDAALAAHAKARGGK